jgi:tight adherence protein B
VRPAALLALLALLAVAGSASAAAPQLTEIDGKFPARTWVLTLPASRTLAPGDLRVLEDGQPVSDLRVVPGDQAGSRSFGVVLAIDTSASMHGAAIRGAMAAARAFAAQLRPTQELGLVLFDHASVPALAPTADRAQIASGLSGTPALSRGTRIYDAGLAAIHMLQGARIRAGSVVILSDGADIGSRTTADQLTRAAAASRVRIYTVGLRSASFSAGTLQGIAAAAHGAYSEAGNGADLKRIYHALGQQLSADYLVSYRSPSKLGTHVAVSARVTGLPQVATASYDTPAFTSIALRPQRPAGGIWHSPAALALTIAIVALLVAAALMLVLRGPQRTVTDRISDYLIEQPRLARDERPAVSVTHTLEKSLRKASWWPQMVEQVELAGIRRAPAQVVSITLVGTLALFWLALIAQRPLAAVILLFTPLAVRTWVRMRVRRRRVLFADQLADNLQVIASAMRAGHSFDGGLAVAAEDAAEPIRGELRRVVSDIRLGVPVLEAMNGVGRRMDSREFEQIGVVVELQRESGGNTAELLDRTVETLRHRDELRRLTASLTGQGKMGGVIVTALPVASALVLSLLSPGYLKPMIDRPVGQVLMVMAGLMVCLGWLVIRKIVDIKV